jgi:dihydrolipoamide dehydrogenase
MAERTVDVVVLGAGPAGEVAAGRLAGAGLEVVIAEEHLVGGECAFYACIPSKALLHPGHELAEARRTEGVRQAVTGDLDAPAVLARRDEVVRDLDDRGQIPWLDGLGIGLVRGHARLDGERRVVVGDTVLTARRAVVVATGSDAKVPPVPGLAEARPWTNRQGTTARAVPGRLAVIGGGVVGVELGQAWQSLGSRVTVLEPGPGVLGHEEPFAAEEVEAGLRAAGVDVRIEQRAERVERDGDGTVRLTLSGGEVLEADEVLVGTGRTPRTATIGLETVGLTPGESIATDDHLRAVGAEGWLYAIGDCNGRALLTHQGKYHARVAADHLLGRPGGRLAGGPPPRVIFTEPQVAAVGQTLATAEEAGLRVEALDADVNATAGSLYAGPGVPGRARLVVDTDREVLVGATFTGAGVAELLHGATIAIVGEVPLERLGHAVPSFPTRSEVWLELLAQH